MLTHECMHDGKRVDVQISVALWLFQDIAAVLAQAFGCWLMGLLGMPPLFGAE